MRIFLAIDDSKFSEAATQTVIAEARPRQDEVRVVNVVDTFPPLFMQMNQYYTGVEHARDSQIKPAEALVTKAAELSRSRGLQATTVVELGSPKSIIIDTAAEWHADLIFLGSHGQTGLEHFLMGSVSDVVARHARCSVKVVRIRSLR